MHKNELNRISNAITRNAPAGKDASDTLVECLTDAVCGITKMLLQIDHTLNAVLERSPINNGQSMMTAEEASKDSLGIACGFPRREEANISWSDRLKCRWIRWETWGEGILALYIPKGECCDKRGAISVAKSLMPDVLIIVVHAGESIYTTYDRLEKKWIANYVG